MEFKYSFVLNREKYYADFRLWLCVNLRASRRQVKYLLSETMFQARKGKSPPSSSDALMKLLKNIGWQLRTIASPPLLKYAILFWTIYAANMFG